MYLGNLSDTDQVVARVVRWVSIGLLAGLAVTGIWQFFFHEASTAWSRYELGSDRFLIPTRSTGIAEAHAAFADIAGLFCLFVIAWLSARVLHRVSWLAIGALVVVIVSLYTGTLIRFNTTIDGASVVTDTKGYGQFFWGSTEGAVTDRFELDRISVVLWTLAHIVSLPILVWATSFTLKRSERNRIARKGQRPSWLDKIDSAS